MASQIDWTWLDVVPDWGPKSAATPERRRWQTGNEKASISDQEMM